MKAQDARQITDSTLTQFNTCLDLIKESSNNGQDHCFSILPLNKATTLKLQELGYKVRNSEHQSEISW